jgi:hypothetical protein
MRLNLLGRIPAIKVSIKIETIKAKLKALLIRWGLL